MTEGFNRLLGIQLKGVDSDGVFWIELMAGADHVHDKGFVHGGVILSLLDIAMSRASRHDREAGAYMPTIEFSASFVRPLKGGIVRARGKVTFASRSLTRVDGAVLDGDGRICAVARGAFMSPAHRG